MAPDTIKNKGRARIFRNDVLELLTKTHPVIVFSMYIPIISLSLYYGISNHLLSVSTTLILFFAGLFFWSFFEYIVHRFVFHMLMESDKGKRIVYILHGVHHEYPRDKDRLFMPPVPSLLLAVLVFSIFHVLMGTYSLAFFPGFVLGYLAYGSMHYAIHAFAPPRFLKALWRNHHLHHYKFPDKGYGVSSVLWDWVFGTVPAKEHHAKP